MSGLFDEKDLVNTNVLPQHSGISGGNGSNQVENLFSHKSIVKDLGDQSDAKALKEAQADIKLAADSGYAPELRRNFSIWSLLGVGFGLTNSWFGISASLVTGISSGGPMLIIYGIIIVACASSCIGISLAELASAFPNAGGQYYWTMRLAPPKYSAFAAYLCGSFAWAGAVFTSASVTISIATALVGMYVLGSGDPDMTIETWQVFVTYEIVNFLLVFANLWEKPLPKLSSISLYVSICSFLVITITVLATTRGDFQDPSFVFATFNNGTGWSSAGIAFIVGLVNPNWSFSCLDCATHLAEELIHPERDIPIAIMGTVAIGFVTSFSYLIAMFFSIKDLDELFNSNTGVPILDIYYQVLQSKGGAIVLECLVLLTAIGCNINSHTWQARLCWSFARDNGLPGSRYWSQVNLKTKVPINAHIMSCVWCAIIGCIYMGSTTAYNAMVVGCIIFLLLSYIVPVIFLLKKGRDNIEHGPFWLGKFGLMANIVLICWTIFGTVFYSFPSVQPVTAGNMNYVCVVFGVYFAYCVIYWHARGKKKFITIDDREQAKHELVQQLSNNYDQLEQTLSKQKVM